MLVAVGRAPVTDGVGLENVGLEADRGFLVVDKAQQTGSKGGLRGWRHCRERSPAGTRKLRRGHHSRHSDSYWSFKAGRV